MNSYTQTYRTQEIQTASQEQILIMLYEGAIRFLKQANQGLAQGDVEKFHNNIIKTQRIVMEFMTTLDVEVGGEMAENLLRLYEYLHYRLIQANVKKDGTMVDEVLEHLQSLKETWEEAIEVARQEEAHSRSNHSSPEGHVYSA